MKWTLAPIPRARNSSMKRARSIAAVDVEADGVEVPGVLVALARGCGGVTTAGRPGEVRHRSGPRSAAALGLRSATRRS